MEISSQREIDELSSERAEKTMSTDWIDKKKIGICDIADDEQS